ncbi:hypothetical protein [Megasphaera sp. AM44-1BH]|jgi:hypothetical protein|uniref:hypothetical protein n=1 Tax=Megasphaera sp. AM44-1BH TaxID=2292358 RepID=UPI000E4EE9FA|nr:hypothetical protein [Megasphaera sp. AM44-1BH]RHA11720.1 hypothetical protein DW949_08155 [Megasphaera sp. AM44-1BH]
MTDKEKRPCEDMEQKKLDIKAFLHVKKGQPLPDCPFRLKVTGKTNVDVIVGDEAVTKKA